MKKQKQIVTGLFWWIAKNFIYYFLLNHRQNIFITFYFLEVKSNLTTSTS